MVSLLAHRLLEGNSMLRSIAKVYARTLLQRSGMHVPEAQVQLWCHKKQFFPSHSLVMKMSTSNSNSFAIDDGKHGLEEARQLIADVADEIDDPGMSSKDRALHRRARKVARGKTVQSRPSVTRHFRVAIIGRPNVGKSTLFNRLAGRREAIVSDIPGTTRDRRETKARLGDMEFTLIDTGGLEEAPATPIEKAMKEQAQAAVASADLVLFMVDARDGILHDDRVIAKWARQRLDSRRVKLIGNKVEGLAAKGQLDDVFTVFAAEACTLGFGMPLPVSAEHGIGMSDLYSIMEPFGFMTLEEAEKLKAEDPDNHLLPVKAEVVPRGFEALTREELIARDKEPLQLAIVGRPNVGKSTLLNRLVESERVITGATPGLTRDAIAVTWEYQGRTVHLVDTAGIRKVGKRDSSTPLEYLSVQSAIKAIKRAHVVVLVLDGKEHLTQQDLTVAYTALEEGRGLVLAINKADVMMDTDVAIEQLREWCTTRLPSVGHVPVVAISAKTGLNCEYILPAALHCFDNWRTRVSTSLLNDWLGAVYRRHPPPRHKGHQMKFKYITQASSRPPTFVLFSSRLKMPDTYKRFLTNSLREEFNLHGVPLRVHTRSRENPYDPKRPHDLTPSEIKKEKNSPANKVKALQQKAVRMAKSKRMHKLRQRRSK